MFTGYDAIYIDGSGSIIREPAKEQLQRIEKILNTPDSGHNVLWLGFTGARPYHKGPTYGGSPNVVNFLEHRARGNYKRPLVLIDNDVEAQQFEVLLMKAYEQSPFNFTVSVLSFERFLERYEKLFEFASGGCRISVEESTPLQLSGKGWEDEVKSLIKEHDLLVQERASQHTDVTTRKERNKLKKETLIAAIAEGGSPEEIAARLIEKEEAIKCYRVSSGPGTDTYEADEVKVDKNSVQFFLDGSLVAGYSLNGGTVIWRVAEPKC